MGALVALIVSPRANFNAYSAKLDPFRALGMAGAADEFLMRCLHCGKELALLKRLTGGAEFCSEAHRKEYQKEFNDLALNRLLQSHPKSTLQPPTEIEPPAPAVTEPPPSPVPNPGIPEMTGFLIEALSLNPPEPAAMRRDDMAFPVDEFLVVATVPSLPYTRRQPKGMPEPILIPLETVSLLPHSPAAQPVIWHAPPRPFVLEPTHLDFDTIRSGDSHPQPEPPPMHAEPLPVTLQGVSPSIAKPVSVVGDALPARIELLAPSGLPLRPSIVLQPKLAGLSTAAAVTESPAARPQEAPSVASIPLAMEPPGLVPPEPIQPSPVVQLGLPELRPLEHKGVWARMPMALKAAMAAVIVLSVGGVAYLTLNSKSATAKPVAAEAHWEKGSQVNINGWIDDWAPADPLRRVTLLKGTENLINYRLEFTAQIQSKAIGWMFRGLNPKNYYVAKIEKIKPGLDPVVALVRYAVIDGRNEGRTEKILPMKVHADTSYKIRFDATGSRFAVWVMGTKVDEWQDSRLGSGGLGLYSESGEAPALQGGVNAWELIDSTTGQ